MPRSLCLPLLALLTGCALAAPAVHWRIVDPGAPTEDVVVCGYDVTEFGAKGDGTVDCAEAFQQALDAMAAAGGGAVFVPAGKYALQGNLKVPSGVTLRGVWTKPEPGRPVTGTILMVTAGKGEAEGQPFCDLEMSSGVMDLAFWYPEQQADSIVAYPYTIRHRSGNNSTVRNVTLVNSYQGLWVQGPGVECHYFVNVYGTVLKTGLEIDYVSDIGRVENVHLSPDYWADSGLPGAPAKGSSYAKRMYENGIGFLLHRSDWPYDYDVSLQGYATGLKLLNGPSKGCANGQFFRLNITDCRTAVDLVHGGPNMFTHCVLQGDEVGINLRDSRHGALLLNSCRVSGQKAALQSDGPAAISAELCRFEQPVVVNRGSLVATDCDFQGAQPLTLGPAVEAAGLLGNRLPDGKQIVNQSGSAFITIDPTPVKLEPTPDYQHPTFVPHKPLKSRLYLVMGAKGDGVADDTEAIQATLDRAGQAGGGIVFLPGGKYGLHGNLTVPPGVELRGAYDVPSHSNAISRGRGSLVYVYGGKGQETGPPAVTLQAGAGIRGVSFFYPEQSVTEPVPFPYLLQGTGADVYVINVTAANPYHFLDLFSHRCDRHFVDYLSGAVIRTGVRVGGGSVGGLVQNAQFNQHYWGRSIFPNLPGDRKLFQKLPDFMYAHQDGFVLGDCHDEVMFHNFVIPSHRGLVLQQDDGRGPNALVVGHGTDWAQYAMVIEGVGQQGVTLVNTQLVAVLREHPSAYVLLTDQFQQRVRLINSTMWGHPRSAIVVQGGELTLQQANLAPLGDGVHVNHGSLRLVNSLCGTPTTFDVEQAESVQSQANLYTNGLLGPSATKVASTADTQREATPRPDAKDISVVLSYPQRVDGLRLVESNGETLNQPTTKAGRAGWTAVERAEQLQGLRYVYFNVTNAGFREGQHPKLTIELDYFDEGDCDAQLVYDSSDQRVKVTAERPGAWKSAGRLHFGQTGTWQTMTFKVHDALFSGRCNGSDLRLNVSGGHDVTLGAMRIRVLE